MSETTEAQLLAHLSEADYVPETLPQLQESLGIAEDASAQAELAQTLEALIEQGTVALIKEDCYCIAQHADLVPGTALFSPSGSAIVKPGPGEVLPGEADVVHITAGATGVAMHGDRVLVRLDKCRLKEKPRYRKGKKIKSKLVEPDKTCGSIVQVLKRARTSLTGTLEKTRVAWFVIPDEPKIHKDILVPSPKEATTQAGKKAKPGEKVVVELAPWENRHISPEGDITRVLGAAFAPSAEYEALLHNYSLDPNFSEAVENEAQSFGTEVPAGSSEGRLDCRDILTLTIDPTDAKDFDDALSIQPLENGTVRIGVHIADVSAYVKPGSALDKEAKKRGNSTYLVGTVIPMLPHALSSGLCSLVEAEDRLAKAVFFTFEHDGEIVDVTFANTIIRSNKRLSYEQAMAFLNAEDGDTEAIRNFPSPPAHQTGFAGRDLKDMQGVELETLQAAIKIFQQLALRLRINRFKKGALDLEMPEVKIYVDEEGWADRIVPVQHDVSHQLVEEFMLAANEAIAHALHLQGMAYISRVHDEPDPDKLDELRETLSTFGVHTGDLTNRSEVTGMLAEAADHPQGHTLKIHLLRSLKRACYRAHADGHYGLAKEFYAHFTSPIRRYSDLVVHRVLDGFLQKQQMPTAPKETVNQYTQAVQDHIALHVSQTERNSVDAERESVKIKLLEFFEREVERGEKTEFEALITEVMGHGFFVELTGSLAFGMVRISSVKDDFYQLSHDRLSLMGRRQGRKFTVGNKIHVTVKKVDRFKRQIDFRVVDA